MRYSLREALYELLIDMAFKYDLYIEQSTQYLL